MRTSRKIAPSFSDNVLNFELPKSWEEFSQDQLRVVFSHMAFYDRLEACMRIIMALTGIKVIRRRPDGSFHCCFRRGLFKVLHFPVTLEQARSFARELSFLFVPGSCTVRLDRMAGREAPDTLLHGVSFGDYLICENHYQGYLYTEDESHLESMWRVLYEDKYGYWIRRPRKYELFSIFLWWSGIKQYFLAMFPDFFRPVSRTGGETQPNMQEMTQLMNAQIRALTGGDITKEGEILDMDCWRALTELNAKAADVESLKRVRNGYIG